MNDENNKGHNHFYAVTIPKIPKRSHKAAFIQFGKKNKNSFLEKREKEEIYKNFAVYQDDLSIHFKSSHVFCGIDGYVRKFNEISISQQINNPHM